jgi:hypothetical protein
MDLRENIIQAGIDAIEELISYLANTFSSSAKVSTEKFTKDLSNQLYLKGIQVESGRLISILAKNGILTLDGSSLYAKEGLRFGATGGKAILGNNSSISTSKSSIHAGQGMSMTATGRAFIDMQSNGDIIFKV